MQVPSSKLDESFNFHREHPRVLGKKPRAPQAAIHYITAGVGAVRPSACRAARRPARPAPWCSTCSAPTGALSTRTPCSTLAATKSAWPTSMTSGRSRSTAWLAAFAHRSHQGTE